jgi:hypothetical protein
LSKRSTSRVGMKPWQERRGVEFVVVEIALHLERPARRSRRRRHATSSSSSDFVILARPAAGEPPFVGALADVVFGTHLRDEQRRLGLQVVGKAA